MKNIKYVAEQFLTDRVAIVDFPYIENLVTPLFNGFNSVLRLSRDELFKWQIHYKGLSKYPDHGIIFPKSETHDQKWMFMYRTHILSDYYRHGRLTQYNLVAYDVWFNLLHQAHRMLFSVVAELAEELDSQLPGYNLFTQVNDPLVEDVHPLRLVQYLHDESVARGKPLANGHYDLGFITAQAYASHQGLDFIPNYREGLPVSEWKRISYPQKRGKVALFPGKKFAKATNDVIPAMYHEVTGVCGENREALIFFSHTAVPSEESR
jgi:hypothetical protein